MIAALPMYDMVALQGANDAFWAAVREALRARGIAAPDTLNRDIGMWEGWQSPDLVLGQTCGMPYRIRLHGTVTLIAAADYGLDDTPPGYYHSVFVARADAPGDGPEAFAADRFAYNQPESHSGWAAPQTWAAARGFRFDPAVETGGHRLSALAVVEGRADIAALDAVSWRFLTRYDPALTDRLRVVGRTQTAPGLPFIAAPGADAAATLAALSEGLAGLDRSTRETLSIRGFVAIPAADYLAVPTPPGP
ncbi:MAG: PhnD/SsuA/transferrin family substrate-binding protein [Rhodobacteraceae bacterium]|nr:PhnD/SsuA/transferrin family substrate-binding protein [Paracoccaceae bacterium]